MKNWPYWLRGVFIGLIISLLIGLAYDILLATGPMLGGFLGGGDPGYFDKEILGLSFFGMVYTLVFTLPIGAIIGLIIGKKHDKKRTKR